MSGFLPKKTRGSPPARRNPMELPNNHIDLVGIRSEACKALAVGDTLEVVLVENGVARSAVCMTVGGEVVGTLAAFIGLAHLISQIESGERFVAHVEAVSPFRCSVLVDCAT